MQRRILRSNLNVLRSLGLCCNIQVDGLLYSVVIFFFCDKNCFHKNVGGPFLLHTQANYWTELQIHIYD
jgi:hypothetical protein